MINDVVIYVKVSVIVVLIPVVTHIGVPIHTKDHLLIIGCSRVGDPVGPDDDVLGGHVGPLVSPHLHLQPQPPHGSVGRIREKGKLIIIIIVHPEVGLQIGPHILPVLAVPEAIPVIWFIGPRFRPGVRIVAHGHFILIGISVPWQGLKTPLIPLGRNIYPRSIADHAIAEDVDGVAEDVQYLRSDNRGKFGDIGPIGSLGVNTTILTSGHILPISNSPKIIEQGYHLITI